jgi:hypothetical protein
LKPLQGQFLPVSLELYPEEGLAVSYRQGKKYVSRPGGAPVKASSTTFLKIRASKDVSLGLHTLKGKLTFQAGQGASPSSNGQIDVSIPLLVADHDARVTDSRWPFASQKSLGDHVKTVLLAPLIIPAALVFIVACGVFDGCDL